MFRWFQIPSPKACLGASLAVGAIVSICGLTTPTAVTANATACTDVDVVVARGTDEAGTLGNPDALGDIVGQPVYSALQQRLTVTSQAYRVKYPASLIQPYSVQQGNRDLVNHVTAQASTCPKQRFILVGYSQGANVVDNSIGVTSVGAAEGGPIVATIPAAAEPRVVAVLLFGNPIRFIGRDVTGVYAARTDDKCAPGDPVCQLVGLYPAAHLSYWRFAGEAAEFAVARV